MEPMIERDQLTALQGENARLIVLLEDHEIEWRLPLEPTPPEPAPPVQKPEPSRLSTAEKVALFRPRVKASSENRGYSGRSFSA